jgi:hypothetical protein
MKALRDQSNDDSQSGFYVVLFGSIVCRCCCPVWPCPSADGRIEFDPTNGHRPNGYVSFRYELTDHLNFGSDSPNVLAVRSDTEKQVASRRYTGSGIYRHVRLVIVDPIHVAYNGTCFATPEITDDRAIVQAEVQVENASGPIVT